MQQKRRNPHQISVGTERGLLSSALAGRFFFLSSNWQGASYAFIFYQDTPSQLLPGAECHQPSTPRSRIPQDAQPLLLTKDAFPSTCHPRWCCPRQAGSHAHFLFPSWVTSSTWSTRPRCAYPELTRCLPRGGATTHPE